ncbi:sigma-70 family RNA polymerase sigma factor [Streptomyces sp. NPDC059631]|uniref:sigma-70 family RNA polymerase sigma factor n=1 Tax=unclassified Streptomyces TaxID=2593676 RepID=UPI0036CACDCB
MREQSTDETALVAAARRGDPAARDRLVSAYLPLVYNVVGRALNGHADVDDVVQDTLLRALSGLDGLRDPARFRAWLVAIAMNQVRRRWSVAQRRPLPLDAAAVDAVEGDFAELTILRLGLSGQRREVAEAARWLDPSDRQVLSLWWLETAGELTRGEVAEALGLSRAHTGVRVQRVKEQLDVCRQVVRATGSRDGCRTLAALTRTWDGTPGSLWRKRIARHLRGCDRCARSARDLLPVDGLLAGMGLVAVPLALHAAPLTGHGTAALAAHGGAAHGAAAVHRVLDAGRRAVRPGTAAKATAAGAAVAAVALLITVYRAPEKEPDAAPPVRPTATAPAASQPPALPDPPTSPDVRPAATTPAPARTSAPAPARTPASTPVATARAVEAASRRDLLDRTNALRASSGCAPLRTDPRLTRVAQSDARAVAARGTVDPPGGRTADVGERVTAAGYAWTSVGEATAFGDKDAAAVAREWAEDHMRQLLVDCRYTDVGVGLVVSGSERAWTEVLAGS